MVWRPFATKLETAETMEDVALNMRAPYFYPTVAPDIDVDLFFWNGWWWRLWEGRWYRSHYYNRGWGYYKNVPSFYFDVDPGWRGYYRDRNWYGHRWDYQRIPNQQLQQNWKSWQNDRRWERRGTWGVQNYQAQLQQRRGHIIRDLHQQHSFQVFPTKTGGMAGMAHTPSDWMAGASCGFLEILLFRIKRDGRIAWI
jgi:hypothetical protein